MKFEIDQLQVGLVPEPGIGYCISFMIEKQRKWLKGNEKCPFPTYFRGSNDMP